MSCHEMESRLDAHVDGELGPDELTRVERHLDGCPGCRRAVEEIRRLTADAAGLPQEIAPDRDLFPAIRQRIERDASPESATVGTRWIGWAAAVLVVGLVGGAGLWFGSRPDVHLATGSQARTAAQAAANPIDAAVHDYIEAGELLLSAIRERRERLSPETLTVLDKNLAIIDAAIEEVRAALESEPAGSVSSDVLRAMHEQRVQLLLRFNQITS